MNKAVKYIFALLFINFHLFTCNSLQAQTSLSDAERQAIVQQLTKDMLNSMNSKPSGQISDKLTISGYLETYYSYDFANPANHVRQPFVYSFNRHNEVNLNLGFIKVAYQAEIVRTNFAIMTGTYCNDNLAAEPGVMKNIFEANTGIKISKKKNLWVDAGIFSSHIGFESAIGKDCWNLTRSILADNSPYYETGVKLSYTTDNNKWFISGLLLNGWQRIYRPDGNNSPAFGTQITFTPSSVVTINFSTFIGNDKPDSSRQMRYFNNFYGIINLNDRIHMIAGFDYGLEQRAKDSQEYNDWYSPVLIVKVNVNSQWSVSARGEYYKDKNGVIIHTEAENGFRTTGVSLNVDYQILANAVFRIEGRTLKSKDKIFNKKEGTVNTNTFVITSLAISF
jgi:hypothetical protein